MIQLQVHDTYYSDTPNIEMLYITMSCSDKVRVRVSILSIMMYTISNMSFNYSNIIFMMRCNCKVCFDTSFPLSERHAHTNKAIIPNFFYNAYFTCSNVSSTSYIIIVFFCFFLEHQDNTERESTNIIIYTPVHVQWY